MLAGTTDTATPGEANLILANGVRTLLRGFMDGVNDADRDADGLPDGSELWKDAIVGMDVGFEVDVPWLEVDPGSGSIEPGGSEALDLTVDATGLEPGAYRAAVVVLTDAPRQERLTVDVELVVTPYRQAVNVGGGEYTDTAGDPWAADQAFDGSWGRESRTSVASTRRDIAGTEDDPLYRDARSGGAFAYRFDGCRTGPTRSSWRSPRSSGSGRAAACSTSRPTPCRCSSATTSPRTSAATPPSPSGSRSR